MISVTVNQRVSLHQIKTLYCCSYVQNTEGVVDMTARLPTLRVVTTQITTERPHGTLPHSPREVRHSTIDSLSLYSVHTRARVFWWVSSIFTTV